MVSEMDVVLIVALIVIFIFSFCGLLHKIRKTYEADQIRQENIASRQRVSDLSFVEIYINPSFVNDERTDGVFPTSPPPYSEFFPEAPPKYEDIIKNNDNNNNSAGN